LGVAARVVFDGWLLAIAAGAQKLLGEVVEGIGRFGDVPGKHGMMPRWFDGRVISRKHTIPRRCACAHRGGFFSRIFVQTPGAAGIAPPRSHISDSGAMKRRPGTFSLSF